MYKYAASLIGLQQLFFGAIWFFDPMFVLELWGTGNPSQMLLAERLLGIFLVQSGTLWLLSRNSGPSTARSAIVCGVIFGELMILMIYAQDMRAGHGGSGVLAGFGMNVVMLLVFVIIEWRAHRQRKAMAQR